MEILKNIKNDLIVFWYIKTTETKILFDECFGTMYFVFNNIKYELPYYEPNIRCMRHAALLRHLLNKGIDSPLAKELAECWMSKN